MTTSAPASRYFTTSSPDSTPVVAASEQATWRRSSAIHVRGSRPSCGVESVTECVADASALARAVDLRVRTGAGFIDVHGVHGNVDVKSDGGDIELRSIQGAIQAETTGGAIEASLGTAPRDAQQRLATTTGDIDLGIDDHLDAAIDMATSALFATDFSLDVTRRPGEEPNKRASTTVGRDASKLTIESRRGQIRLRRRAGFTSVGDASSDAPAGRDQDEDNDSD